MYYTIRKLSEPWYNLRYVRGKIIDDTFYYTDETEEEVTQKLNTIELRKVTQEEYNLSSHDIDTFRGLSFYIKYTPEFTEDFYNYLLEWSKKATKNELRNYDDSYEGLQKYGYFIYSTFGIHSNFSSMFEENIFLAYGVDNNRQGITKELSVVEAKVLVGYLEIPKEKTATSLKKEEFLKLFPIGCIVSSTDKSCDVLIAHHNFTYHYDVEANIVSVLYEDVLLYDRILNNAIFAEVIKPTGEWFPGSYIVTLNDNIQHTLFSKNSILKIFSTKEDNISVAYKMGFSYRDPKIREQLKWFPTLEQANAFRLELERDNRKNNPICYPVAIEKAKELQKSDLTKEIDLIIL